MKKLLAFCAALLVAPVAVAGPWDDVVKYGYAVSGGPLTGALAFAVCVQADDDTTPSIGTPPAALPTGCNILLTSTNHGGAITITRFDDALSGIEPVTLGLYEQTLWVFGRAATNQTTIADGGDFRLKTISWDSPATGDHSVIQFKATYDTDSITAFGNGGGGQVVVTAANALQENQTVVITGATDPNYNGTFTATSVTGANFEITTTWGATDTGTYETVRFDEAWRSGNVDDYFYQQIFVNDGNITDFPNAQVVVGEADHGAADARNIGVVAEALAVGGTRDAVAFYGAGETDGANNAAGAEFVASVTNTADTGVAYGSRCITTETHAGGDNVGLYIEASGSSTDNYAIEVKAGHVVATLGTDFNIYAEDTTTAAATNPVNLYSGAASNAGDYDTGAVSVFSGGTTTLGNSGVVGLSSGNAADSSGAVAVYSGTSANTTEVSGDVAMYSGAQSHATGGSSGSASVYTGTAAGQAATGVLNLYTGNQTNTGDYASGQIDIQSGTSATLGDTGAIAVRSGNAADTSGAASLYSGTSANAGEASGAVALYSGAQASATGGSSGTAKLYTGAAAGTAATGAVDVYTGNQTNVGDYDSGAVGVASGTTATLGDTGAVTVKSGNAADTSGEVTVESGTSANTGESSGGVIVGTGNQTHATGSNSGDLTLDTGTAAGTGDTGAVLLASGDQSNVGDYASGTITIETGMSATLGDTGAVALRSGNAADTSGAVACYSGTSANTGEVSGDVGLYSGAQTNATGGSTGSASVYTGDVTGQAASGVLNLYTGDQNNTGDYNSGQVDVYSGGSTTAGDTGAVAIRSGDAADTSGAVTLYSGTSAGAGEASGAINVYTGNQSSGTGGASGLVAVRSGTAAGTAATGNVSLYSGVQGNAGDYNSGSASLYSGATTTLGDTGVVVVRSGDAADTSGDVSIYSGSSANTGEASGTVSLTSGNQTHATGGGSGSATISTGSAAGTGLSGGITMYTGAQTNAGDVDSGDFTCYTGATTTDGDTGDIKLTTGAAGAGAADAGSFIVETHGANARLTIDGAGVATLTGALDAESYMALGNSTALSSNKTLVIDRDFSDTSDGEALSVVGSQIEVTAGTGDIHHVMVNPGATTFSTAATVHGYATSLNILEPNIALAGGATVTHAATVRIVNAPTEGVTSNWALWVDGDDVKFDGDLTVDGTATLGAISMAGDLDMNDYDILDLDAAYGVAPTSDVAPTDTDFKASHAYSQATGGNQVGASVYVSSGVGTRQVTIDDFNNCGGDTVTLTINGADTVCTEAGGGCTWTAAADNATTATSLAAAIDALSNLSASSVAAVVYIVPDDENIRALDLAEGDPTCTTLTEGTDGSVVISTAHGSLIVSPSGLIQFGGTTASFPAIQRNAAQIILRLADLSNYAELLAGNMYSYGNMRIAATARYSFLNRTELYADVDGDLKITNDDVDQGVYLNTQTDGVANFYDEVGGALVVGANTFQNTLVGATATFGSVLTATGAATGAVDIGSGNNTNAGNFATGNVSLTSGDTTDTDGNSGSVTVGSGAAAAGTADAGDLYLQTHDVTRVTVAGNGGNVTIAEDLIVSGVGPHAIGTTVYDYSQVKIGGAFISGGADLHAERVLIQDELTGANGDTQRLSTMDIMGSIKTQTAEETIGLVAQVIIRDPTITDQLGGAGVITDAATLYIEAAPTEGNVRNAALLVDAGATILDGTLTVGDQLTCNNGAIFTNGVTFNNGVTFDDTATFPNSGLHILDTGGDHDLIIAPGTDLGADRQLTLTTGDAARTLTFESDAIVSQDYSTDSATVQFDDLTLTDDLLLADGAVVGITGNEVITFDAAGTVAVSGAVLTTEGLTTTGPHINTPGSQELSVAETATVTAKWLKVYSDGGAVASTADPTVSAGTADGQEACFRGTSDVNTIEFQDEDNNAGSTLELDGGIDFVFGLGDTLCLTWDSTNSKWFEVSRSDN